MIDFGLVYVAESPIFIQGDKYFYPSDPKISQGSEFPIGLDLKKPYKRVKGLGAMERDEIYKAFYDKSIRRLVQVTTENIDYAMNLVEEINMRKQLLTNKGILTNPYNFTDL